MALGEVLDFEDLKMFGTTGSLKFIGILDNLNEIPIPPAGTIVNIKSNNKCYVSSGTEWFELKSYNDEAIEKEVIKFIDNFKGDYKNEIEDVFYNGYCFWFAKILKERFNGTIYFDEVSVHFACMIANKLFDIKGIISEEESKRFVMWNEYKSSRDSMNTKRIYRDCILKLNSDTPIDYENNTCGGIELKIYDGEDN